jgi:hypothetical protein
MNTRLIELTKIKLNSKKLGKELKKLLKSEFKLDYGGCMCEQEERDALQEYAKQLINERNEQGTN